MINFGFKRRGQSLPRAGLLCDIPNRYPFVDRVGKHDGPPQLLQYASVSGASLTLYHASIVGTETITSHGGTANVSVIAGGITIGIGTSWEIRDSAGHHWSHCAALSPTSVVMWDVGLGDHLIAEGLSEAVVAALCSSGREFGTDWLDSMGWTEGSAELFFDQTGSKAIPDGVVAPRPAAYIFEDHTEVSRVVRNLCKNSILSSASGITPSGYTQYGSGGVSSVSQSEVHPGEYAYTSEATANRAHTGYTITPIISPGRRYVAGCFVESAENLPPDGCIIMGVTGASVVLSQGSQYLRIGDGMRGLATFEFVLASYVGVALHLGVGSIQAGTGRVRISRPCIYDITDLVPRAVYLPDEYITTTSVDATGRAESHSFRAPSKSISIWGDSQVAYSASQCFAYLQSRLGNKNVWNGGIGGESSTLIRNRMLGQPERYGDIIIIMAGRNNYTSPDVVKADIASMAAVADDYFVYGINARTDGTEAIGSAARNIIEALNAELADIYGDRFRNLNDAMASDDTRSDGLHPNAKGSLIISNSFYECIKTTYRKLLPDQYVGPPRNNITRLTGTSATISPTDTCKLADTKAARDATGFVYGVDHWGYTSTGIPKEVSGSVLIANGGGDQFFCGSKRIAGYSTVQVEPALAKIKRLTGV